MQNKLSPILSFAAIGIFLLFVIASGESTNTTVSTKGCEPKPGFTGTLNVSLTFAYEHGLVIDGATGTLFLTHQIIEDTMTCTALIVSQQQIPFTTNAAGSFYFTTEEYTHANEGDLWRAEVYIPPLEGHYFGFRKVDIAKYSRSYISIRGIEPPAL